jgi:glycine/sarcosine N-methyltransferase
MAHKTENADARLEIASFYDRLAPTYDAMTAPEKRFARERPFFSGLVQEYGIRSAVDAGSGTGFHALLLSQLGVRVTAVDLSPQMLLRLSANAEAAHVQIPTVQASLQDLPSRISGHVDALVCMGNTITHILSRQVLEETIRGFAGIIRSGGVLLLHVLNYEKILSQRQRIQSVREEQGVMFIRFYDFEEDLLRFNMLRLERRGGDIFPHLSSVDLRPVLLPELKEVLGMGGFAAMKIYGDIGMSVFDPATSPDLIVLAVNQQPPDRS